ncbi:class I SAM-dependent methyltransferase [Methylocystis sp.]|uniref:class I SAM-dependent methyltransferase n=1 Tax=Methylocystis sp. TaxID=1911079 RepID=UPI003DA643F5
MSDSYARWRASRLGRITDALEQELLFDLLGPIAGKNLLDVGCGDGAIASELARRGAVVTGLDPDPVAISAAWRRGAEGVQLRLAEGKAESLPVSDATFDAVLAVATLCFIPDAQRAIAEMVRALRPGGRLVIGELGRWSLWAAYRRFRAWFGHPTWRAARFRSETELRHLLEAGGGRCRRDARRRLLPAVRGRRASACRRRFMARETNKSRCGLHRLSGGEACRNAASSYAPKRARNRHAANRPSQGWRRVDNLLCRKSIARSAPPKGSELLRTLDSAAATRSRLRTH